MLLVLELEHPSEIINAGSPWLLGTPFHFTLPKEGDTIQPLTSVTPPLTGQLKMGPRRHSTPIGKFNLNSSSVKTCSEAFVSRCRMIG